MFPFIFKRVIDYVPALIDLRFVRAAAKDLLPFLIQKFELERTLHQVPSGGL